MYINIELKTINICFSMQVALFRDIFRLYSHCLKKTIIKIIFNNFRKNSRRGT